MRVGRSAACGRSSSPRTRRASCSSTPPRSTWSPRPCTAPGSGTSTSRRPPPPPSQPRPRLRTHPKGTTMTITTQLTDHYRAPRQAAEGLEQRRLQQDRRPDRPGLRAPRRPRRRDARRAGPRRRDRHGPRRPRRRSPLGEGRPASTTSPSCSTSPAAAPRPRSWTSSSSRSDAEDLPYGDASFDVVLSAIGVMFAADHAARRSRARPGVPPRRPHRRWPAGRPRASSAACSPPSARTSPRRPGRSRRPAGASRPSSPSSSVTTSPTWRR